jgi:hypothetical protein
MDDVAPDAAAPVAVPSLDGEVIPTTAPAPVDLSPVVCTGAVPELVDTAQSCRGAGGFPSNCVRPPGVNWIEADYQNTFTVALPAGVYWEDPVAGCLWAVVWPGVDGHATLETAALGCTTSIRVPHTYVPGGCGYSYSDVEGCERIGIAAAVCFSSGRGAEASGGMTFNIDAVKGTLSSGGLGFDTSYSPAACGCP